MDISLNTVIGKKSLLAFSGGVDSSALFHILLENKIDFDIAIVNYNIRDTSHLEVQYAESLATKYNKKIYIHNCDISNESNQEKVARDIRYKFFEDVIEKNNYNTLITAHQLNDRMEWFLMQFTKGAGLKELMGYKEVDKRSTYSLVRPMLNVSRDELQEYLELHGINYFVDQTNFDKKYKRNYFRQEFSNTLISEFKDGISKSFEYLDKDARIYDVDMNIYKLYDKVYSVTSLDDALDIRTIDIILKKDFGYLMSSKQREEILKYDVVLSNRIVIQKDDTNQIWISPFVVSTMDKEFKEKCRKAKIPSKVRPYLWELGVDV